MQVGVRNELQRLVAGFVGVRSSPQSTRAADAAVQTPDAGTHRVQQLRFGCPAGGVVAKWFGCIDRLGLMAKRAVASLDGVLVNREAQNLWGVHFYRWLQEVLHL